MGGNQEAHDKERVEVFGDLESELAESVSCAKGHKNGDDGGDRRIENAVEDKHTQLSELPRPHKVTEKQRFRESEHIVNDIGMGLEGAV